MHVRFWEKVDTSGDCWVWTGTRDQGYGKFKAGQGNILAHRWAYEQEYGAIPEGHTLHHLCGNRPCVRASHLSTMSRSEHSSLPRQCGQLAIQYAAEGCYI